MSLSTTVGLQFIARDRSRAGINSFNRNLSISSARVRSLSRNILALTGVGGGIYMLGNALRSGVQESAAFSKQMANVSTMLSGQAMSLMPRYAQEIRKMSKEFGEGTETLSKGLYDILSASIAPAKALDVLTVSTRAAKAGLTDTGIAADAITTILNSYGLSADHAADVSDKLFAIVVRGKTTFGELAPNIGKVAALAATAGESFSDLGAVIATMTRAGVQTEIAMTSLRAIILSFLKPQTDSVEMARKFGVELSSNTLRTIGLTGVIKKLKKATAEELAVIVPTSRAITGFAAAIQKAEGLASDYDFMLNSLGQTETAYQKIAATSAVKLEQLNQEWIDLKRSMGDIIIEPLISIFQTLTKVIDDNRFALKRWASDCVEGAGMVKKVLPIYWLYAGLKIGDLTKQLTEAEKFRPSIPEKSLMGQREAPSSSAELNKRLASLGSNNTEGASAVAEMARKVSYTERLIASMKRENELLVMGTAERIKAQAVDRARLAAQKDSVELTDQQLARVRELALENFRITEDQKYSARDVTAATVRMYDDIDSKSKASYAERRRLLRYELGDYIKLGVDKIEAERWYNAKIKQLQADRLAKDNLPIGTEQIRSATDIAAAYVRMYDDMEAKSAASFAARRRLLQAEYDEYAKYIEDKAMLNEWLNERIMRLEEDRLAASESIAAGISSAWMQLRREVLTTGELTKRVMLRLADQSAGALAAALVRGEDFKEQMKRICLEIIEYLVKVQIMKMVLGMGSGLFGGGNSPNYSTSTSNSGAEIPPSITSGDRYATHERGGIVGRGTSYRTVNPAVFDGAYKYKNGGIAGLKPGEVPIIAHKGERITPAGGPEGGLNVHIHNEGSEPLEITRAKEYLNSDQRIIDVIVRTKDSSVPFGRSLGKG